MVRKSGRKKFKLGGRNLVLLALYRVLFPKARAAEVNAALYRFNYGNPFFSFFSKSQISEAEARLGLTLKRGSTTAYQAFFPVNLRKRWVYWNMPYPMGVADIRKSCMIDLDECGVYLEHLEQHTGKLYVGVCVSAEGPYSRSKEKINLLMAICGEDGGAGQQSRRWATHWYEGGTTIGRIFNFWQEILDAIGVAAHKNKAVVGLIHAYGHGVAYHAPYL